MQLTRSALQHALTPCQECGKVCKIPASSTQGRLHCPRCDQVVHVRKSNSLQRTWALVLLGFGLFVISHIYPVLTMTQLGQGTVSKTIVGGVITLAEDGFWGIAAILFFASFIIPLIKLIGLLWILLAVKRNTSTGRYRLSQVFRVIQWIGRWSMLDIFVLTIWASLVQLGGLAQVEAEFGSSAFGVLVIITMVAVATFDPRLLWDNDSNTTGRSSL